MSDRRLTTSRLIAVATVRQKCRRVRHGAAFALRDGFPTPLHWCGFGAPVAQGIERSPAEAEGACSNHAGRPTARFCSRVLAAKSGTARLRGDLKLGIVWDLRADVAECDAG